MSLFGSSPTDSPLVNSTANSKSLFGDDITPAATSASSLFADDGGEPSPWIMPTPKRAARQDLVKNLLPATDVPESYIDAFDLLVDSKDRVGNGVGLAGIKNILESTRLTSADQTQILNFIVPGGQEPAHGLGRSEFNVLLALIGLAQEGDEVSLDGVDERRRKLPLPKVPYLDKLRLQPREEERTPKPSQPTPLPPSQQTPKETNSARPRRMRRDSLGDPESDPWATPSSRQPSATHGLASGTKSNGIHESSENSAKPSSNGFLPRTTSAFTTHGEQPADSTNEPSGDTSSNTGGASWTGYNGSSSGGFSEQPTLGGGFGDSGGEQGDQGSPNPRRAIGASIAVTQGNGEIVTISLLPEKEGLFMFQHRNYEVKSVRRSSTVVRRYSDFVWLLDCLQKRYPFRRLPLLPPKRVAVNGTHFAADTSVFLERRRKGLTRFANALVQHPVLNQEQLVVMFLTVPTELAVWRKQATISVQEEFVGKSLPPTLEDSLPSNLPDIFDTVRVGVKRSAEIYINLCNLLERLARRNEGLAADNNRFSLALQSLTDSSADTYAIDTNDVPLLNEGVSATAKHLSTSKALLEDEAKAWEEGVLEDLKRQRDCLVGMRDLFDRRDRYARDNIPQLERRIENSEHKLQALRQKPEGMVKPGEIEKVESSIINDKESIVQQHARGVFIKECIRDEIVFFQQSQYVVSKLHQDWSQERVKYSELQASNWRALAEELESMPLGE